METKIKYNYQDYLQLPEDKRYEIIDGDLFKVPSPNESHQRIVTNILYILVNYVRRNKMGAIYCAPFDILFSDEDIVQPDVIFVSNENKKVITKDNIKGSPDLLVEMLSPSTSRRDIGIKKKLYARHGVREYWIVDPERETVDVLRLKGREFESKRYGIPDCLSSNVIKGLMIEVKEIFI
ncbi:MAG: Uma2 family endonuclease [Candidatus Brocadiales bacterium]|nr:Uma2 family endonuclease [Candidatus Brocadiales bacterium]